MPSADDVIPFESISIKEWLRQREPMLFLSRVLELEKDKIIAERMPGQSTKLVVAPAHDECTETLLLEAMGQAAELLYRYQSGKRSDKGYLVRLEHVQVNRLIKRNETLRLVSEIDKVQFQYVSSRCRAMVGEEPIAAAYVTHYYKPEV